MIDIKQKIPVVKVLVKNEDEELLMLKKSSDYNSMGDSWEQTGGKIREEEDRFEAARREIEEETGLVLEDMEDLVRLEIEDQEVLECFVMFCDEFSGEIQLSGEHQDYSWISREEARELDWHRDASYIIPVIEYIGDYRESEVSYAEGDEIEVVKLLIQNQGGKFLVMQKTAEDKIHSGHKYTLYGRMAGKWELPGGRFKGASDRFKAARREVEEETGLRLGEMEDVVREEIEENNDVDTFIIFCDDWDGEMEISKEHQDFRWVSAEEYLELNWHQDAGYGYAPMKFLDYYLSTG